jgi:signal transduction histidine kinase
MKATEITDTRRDDIPGGRGGPEADQVDQLLAEWRARASLAVLIVIAVAGIPAYGAPVLNALGRGSLPPQLWIYITAYAAIVALAVMPRLDPRIRAWGLIVLIYVNGVASFARLGLEGSGRIYLLVQPILATLLLGSRAGYGTGALSLLTFAAFTWLARTGVLAGWITPRGDMFALGTWIEAGTALATFLGMTLVPLERLYRLLLRALEARRQAQAALELSNQTLERRVEERTHELAALNAIAAAVSRSLDLSSIMSDALAQTLEVTGMELGIGYRLEGNVGEASHPPQLKMVIAQGASSSLAAAISPLPLEDTYTERAAPAERPLVWRTAEHPLPLVREALEREGVRIGISVPLVSKGTLVGALLLGSKSEQQVSDHDRSLLAAIGHQIAVAIENARLYERAETAAALAERQRLARELHDSVTQSLYSVTLYAEAANRLLAAGDAQAAGAHLRDLRDTAQEALREMRLLIFELRPVMIEVSGLASALDARLKAVEARAGIETKLFLEGACDPALLPLPVQEELYHLAQEALNNVLKHARARHVEVRLAVGMDGTCLQVVDDGVGFDPGVVRTGGGLGLAGMEERARRLGAQLSLESQPGRGATVRILLAEPRT